MNKVFFSCSLFLVGIFSTTAVLADWASIAYCRNTGVAGWSWDGSSSSSIKEVAIESCVNRGGSRCIAEMTFENYCGSLARPTNDYSKVYEGWSENNRREAGNNALDKCGTNCELITSVCSEQD